MVVLRYRTPLIIRSRGRLRLEPEAVLRSCLRRAAALAPWMGFALDADQAALELAICNLHYLPEIHPERWTRTSYRSPGKPIEVAAYGGSMRVSGRIEPVLPYLALGELAAFGGECASGFGAVDLVIYP